MSSVSRARVLSEDMMQSCDGSQLKLGVNTKPITLSQTATRSHVSVTTRHLSPHLSVKNFQERRRRATLKRRSRWEALRGERDKGNQEERRDVKHKSRTGSRLSSAALLLLPVTVSCALTYAWCSGYCRTCTQEQQIISQTTAWIRRIFPQGFSALRRVCWASVRSVFNNVCISEGLYTSTVQITAVWVLHTHFILHSQHLNSINTGVVLKSLCSVDKLGMAWMIWTGWLGNVCVFTSRRTKSRRADSLKQDSILSLLSENTGSISAD